LVKAIVGFKQLNQKIFLSPNSQHPKTEQPFGSGIPNAALKQPF
jgi:hypothetical protein